MRGRERDETEGEVGVEWEWISGRKDLRGTNWEIEEVESRSLNGSEAGGLGRVILWRTGQSKMGVQERREAVVA